MSVIDYPEVFRKIGILKKIVNDPLMNDPPASELEKIELPVAPPRYPRFFVPTPGYHKIEVINYSNQSIPLSCIRYTDPNTGQALTRVGWINLIEKAASVTTGEWLVSLGKMSEITPDEAKARGYV